MYVSYTILFSENYFILFILFTWYARIFCFGSCQNIILQKRVLLLTWKDQTGTGRE